MPKLYEEFEKLVNSEGGEIKDSQNESSGSIVNNIFSAIAGIFAPLLPALAGSGVLRGLLIFLFNRALFKKRVAPIQFYLLLQ